MAEPNSEANVNVEVNFGWLALAIVWVALIIFSRGCDDSKVSNFDHWLKAAYGYEATADKHGDGAFTE